MIKIKFLSIAISVIFISTPWHSLHSQSSFDEDQLGAWYMYFFNGKFGSTSNFGFQGDVQYRNWDIIGDLEQLLLRGGFYYSPGTTNIRLVLGYANITTGQMGESTETVVENRIYQEAFIPQSIADLVYLTHRFRFEQRNVENQDTRTRLRYALFMNIPLNSRELSPGTWYAALYNELFINGQRQVTNTRTAELFDRNRTYLGLGHVFSDHISLQLGWMRQITDNWNKAQLQLGINHRW